MSMIETTDDKEVFRHHLPIQIRFNDVDRLGHVNNNSYFAFYDLGKEEYLREVMKSDFRSTGIVPVIANINADFFMPVFYGDDIVIETRVVHVGRKSFTLAQRAVNQEKCVVCRCQTVMVCFDFQTQQSVEIPEAFRQAFEDYEKGR